MSKRHPFHSKCLQDLSLVFRDPKDLGSVRMLETPPPTVLVENLLKFVSKWKDVDHEGKKVITPNVMQQITAIQKHMERGCLSHIKVGRGTNRNERLHRQLNSVLKNNLYGPEMGIALITLSFFRHNENILAKREHRQPNPVSAYHASTETDFTECFGLLTPSSDTCPQQPTSCTCLLKNMKYTQLKQMFCTLSSRLDEETLSLESLSYIEAFTLLRKAIGCYFISESIVEKGPSVSVKHAASVMFDSFLHTTSQFSGSISPNDASLTNTLTSWNFRRIAVNGDGNCLFTSVAMLLIANVNSGQIGAKETLARLGVEEKDSTDPVAVARALRSAVVDEWLGENLDHYQGFSTVDIAAHAEEYRHSGEFGGSLGDLMVMTIANIIKMPLLLFTNVENMPIMVITPSLTVADTAVPLYLVYTSTGPGHYDIAVPQETQEKSTKAVKCSCGRKSNFKGVACSSDMLGYCRCPCSRAEVPCGALCNCKDCNNKHGQKPKPATTRRRKAYDNQQQHLRGVSSTDFMASMNEQVSVGSMSSLETIVIQTIIVFCILNGTKVTAEYVHGAFMDILSLSKLCITVDIPIFPRSVRFIANYLKSIYNQIDLWHKLMDN